MKRKPKQQAPRWVNHVVALVTALVTHAEQSLAFVTDQIKLTLVKIWDDGEAEQAESAIETAIRQVDERKAGKVWDGGRRANARRIAAAMAKGKLADGSPFTRETFALAWNELVAKCPTRATQGGAGKPKNKNKGGNDAPSEADGAKLTHGQIEDFLRHAPTSIVQHVFAVTAQILIDRKDAPQALKRDLVKPIETLKKAA